METKTELQNTDITIADQIGSVQIADDVVAMIAALAAVEVEGVSLPASPAAESQGRGSARKMMKNVKVDVAGENVSVDVAVAIDYGYNIPQTGQNVQTRVKAAIENMTGLIVADVNVRVAKVNMQ
ncbi:MAG: Asp23/Gls24 family envelope stress response protein [Lachnospiraceae bacterium]|nr:Asp23/Gls24 family envelope stress response protein [Lachnospiraceae bacterium]